MDFGDFLIWDVEGYFHEAKGLFSLEITTEEFVDDIRRTTGGADTLKREVYNK
jgi:hypothetical protein